MPHGPLLQAHEVQRVPDIIHNFLPKSASLPIVPMSLMAIFMTQARHLGAIFISFLAYIQCAFDYPLFWDVYSSHVSLYFPSINAGGNIGLYLYIDASPQNSHTASQSTLLCPEGTSSAETFLPEHPSQEDNSRFSPDYHLFYSNPHEIMW